MQPNRLSSRNRKWLRGQAHSLKPVVLIGSRGLTEEVVAEVDASLSHHELIKVKVHFDRDERRQIAEQLATKTGSDLAGLVGHMAILFRANRDPAERKIRLPNDPG